MRHSAIALLLLATAYGPCAFAADAQPAPATAADAQPAPAAADKAGDERKPGNEQVIEPELDRRDVRIPKIPSNDFEAGLFTGTYSAQNFGSSLVYGVRLGYHLTEDVFVEGVYGQTKVSDDTFRQILPGGIFPNPKETLRYYNLSAGYNILPGEFFLWKRNAKVTALYVIGGVGSTQFDNQRHLTVNAGFGGRVFLADWAALQLDLRDHIFSYDLLGERKNTQNVELTGGLTFFF
ncbi:MAG TPA: outer membrane beta-barrel domain-containing protein [Burkholderiaceae bacterium]|nr:outer membrane beta-barrel domain-containing protein [Burkholderiaceae bacterium]